MLIKLPVILLFICIGIANYYLMKSFWCHEGYGGKMCTNNKKKIVLNDPLTAIKKPWKIQGFLSDSVNELTFRELRTFTSFT